MEGKGHHREVGENDFIYIGAAIVLEILYVNQFLGKKMMSC